MIILAPAKQVRQAVQKSGHGRYITVRQGQAADRYEHRIVDPAKECSALLEVYSPGANQFLEWLASQLGTR